MAKERALDIFVLLDQVDKKNFQLWDALTDAQKKEFSPLVTMRWMAGTTDERQLIMLNELINTTIFGLTAHPELLLKLLSVCASGKLKRYNWLNYKLSGGKKYKRSVELIAEHYKLSWEDAAEQRPIFDDAELLELAEIQGWQKDEIAELKKELK